MAFELRTNESRYKFIQDRVKCVETSFNDFCQSFGGLVRRNAKLRDKGDELTRQLHDYSQKMSHNSSCTAALESVTKELALVQDYQDIKVKRLEALVVQPLTLYNTIIKQSKADIKAAYDAASREQKSLHEAEHVRQKAPGDARQISKVEIKLQKAHVDASRMSRALEEAIENFEQQKLRDLKAVLGSYIATEMAFHAKSLETLTRCYEQLQVISEEKDLQEFVGVLHPSSATERLSLMKGKQVSGSRTSIASLSPSTTPREAGDSGKVTTGAADSSPSRRSSSAIATRSSPALSSQHKQSVAVATGSAPTTSTPVKPSAPPRQSMLGGDDTDDDDGDDETGDEDEDDDDDDDDDDDEDDEVEESGPQSDTQKGTQQTAAKR